MVYEEVLGTFLLPVVLELAVEQVVATVVASSQSASVASLSYSASCQLLIASIEIFSLH